MLIVEDKEYFEEVKKFAEEKGLWEGLQKELDYLGNYFDPRRTDCHLYKDFAPYSFSFTMDKDGKYWFNGGLIFHGPHDGGGNGGAPTFSVNLNPDLQPHWSVHT